MRAVILYVFFFIFSVLMISLAQESKEMPTSEDASCPTLISNVEAIIPECSSTNHTFFSGSSMSRLVQATLFETNCPQQDPLTKTSIKNYLTKTINLKPLIHKPFRRSAFSVPAKKDDYHLA